jgi:hypothetical protein
VAPLHRTPDGLTAAPAWESLADRLIREAMERGELDSPAWVGRRLPAQDGAYERPEAAANAILRNARAVPGWIDADLEVRRLQAECSALRGQAARTGALGGAALRRRYAGLVHELDRALLRLEVEAPAASVQRPRIDPAAELAAFDRALDGRATGR